MNTIITALALTITFAYLPADCVLYDDNNNAVTTLPATYFVQVLSQEDELLKVAYLDLIGYIRFGDAEIVDYEPVTKFASSTLTACNDGHPVKIRSTPDHNADNVVASLADGQSCLLYGEAQGTSLISAVGNKWYYVRIGQPGNFIHGYVYSAQATTVFTPNVVEKVETKNEEKLRDNSSSIDLSGSKILVVLALCLPVLLLCVLSFRGEQSNRPLHSRHR